MGPCLRFFFQQNLIRHFNPLKLECQLCVGKDSSIHSYQRKNNGCQSLTVTGQSWETRFGLAPNLIMKKYHIRFVFLRCTMILCQFQQFLEICSVILQKALPGETALEGHSAQKLMKIRSNDLTCPVHHRNCCRPDENKGRGLWKLDSPDRFHGTLVNFTGLLGHFLETSSLHV